MPSSAIPLSFSEVKVKKEVAADASKKNATEDAAVFDFWTAPSPPRNHPQTMQWSHREFQQKRISGKFVLTRQVRETWNECMGFYPTFDAPELLDQSQFEKFNYYAYMREEVHHTMERGWLIFHPVRLLIPLELDEPSMEMCLPTRRMKPRKLQGIAASNLRSIPR